VLRPTKQDQKDLLLGGLKLSDEEALLYEAGLADEPDDVAARFKLIGYYNSRLNLAKGGTGLDPELFDHLTWLLQSLLDLPIIQDALTPGLIMANREQIAQLLNTMRTKLATLKQDKPTIANVLRILDQTGQDPQLATRLRGELEIMKLREIAQKET
jgi:hypothetical protein